MSTTERRHQVPPEEINALVSLYDATEGSSWSWGNESLFGAVWNFTVDEVSGELLNNPCDTGGMAWQGVSCTHPPSNCSSRNCSITALRLTGYNLRGHMPAALANLTNLMWLLLDHNQLSNTIPPELGDLRSLAFLDLENNQLSGTIPIELGRLYGLEKLDLDNNGLSGTIPASLKDLINLEWLGLGSNRLTGTIPSSLEELTSIKWIVLQDNELISTIPPTLGSLSNLEWLGLGSNLMTGTIPAKLGNLSNAKWLVFPSNRFSGTIPPELGKLSKLEWLGFGHNQLTGTVPQTLSALENFHWLDLEKNLLSGTVPSELGSIETLEWLGFDFNQLTGRIPSTLSSLPNLGWLELNNNQMTGCIPNGLGNITSLVWLELNSNRLTGTIPSQLAMASFLNALDLSGNILSGQLPTVLHSLESIERLSLFGNSFSGTIPNSWSELTSLEVLDLGDNRLTGTVPVGLGQLSRMKAFILSVNCLDSHFPESVCGMTSVEVLSFNGIGSGDDCTNRHHVLPWLRPVYKDNADASIPDCIWTLERLTLLHVAGNGLVGHIPSSALKHANVRLSDLVLSHNRLDGTIPQLSNSLRHFDVSYNRFTGELRDDNTISVTWPNSSMIAEVNQLSGRLPALMQSVDELNVLRGNMISCETVPSNDVNSKDYKCGSSQYDISLYFMSCSLCIVAAIVVRLLIVRFNAVPSKPSGRSVFSCEEFIKLWCNVLIRHRNFIWLLLLSIWLVFLPSLVLRMLDDEHVYTTHWHVYSWIVSYSYASGQPMAYSTLAMWVIAILMVWLYILSAFGITTSSPMSSISSIASDVVETKYCQWVVIVVSFVANFILTVGINTLYVLSVTEASLSQSTTVLVQFGVSWFRIVSSVCLVPWLSRQVPVATHRIFFRVGLLLLNNLILPCLAISLTSSNCFQELLVPPESIGSTYSFPFCSLFLIDSEGIVCISRSVFHQDTAPFSPSFVYNYQCMFTLFEAYVPVLIIGFSIQLLLSVTVVVSVVHLEVRFDSMPSLIRPGLLGLLWPEYWLSRAQRNEINQTIHEPGELLQAENIICSDMLNPLALLLTFGLSSPPLAALITIVVTSRMTMWHWAINRFISAVKDSGGEYDKVSDELLVRLSKDCVPIDAPMTWSFSLLAVLSMLFTIFVFWDTTAAVSWEAPLFIFMVVLFSVVSLRYKAVIFKCIRSNHMMIEGRSGAIEMSISSSTVNPMRESTID